MLNKKNLLNISTNLTNSSINTFLQYLNNLAQNTSPEEIKLRRILSNLDLHAKKPEERAYLDKIKSLKLYPNKNNYGFEHWEKALSNKQNEYKSLQLLEEYYQKKDPKLYHAAIKEGLLRDIGQIAAEISSSSNSRTPDNTTVLQFISVVQQALEPIIIWTDEIILNSSKSAKLNLDKTGEKIANVLPPGRRRKVPSENSAFSHYFYEMVSFLYKLLLEDFNKAKDFRNISKKKEYMRNQITYELCSNVNLDNLFREEPNHASKKVLCAFLDIRERSLNELLSTNKKRLKLETIIMNILLVYMESKKIST